MINKKKYFENYNECIYCGSKNLKIEKQQFSSLNFYVKAIISDLNLSKKEFNKIKVYKCKKCHILQNNPWFSEAISRKIYSNIYGQHNRSWTNLLNFTKKGTTPPPSCPCAKRDNLSTIFCHGLVSFLPIVSLSCGLEVSDSILQKYPLYILLRIRCSTSVKIPEYREVVAAIFDKISQAMAALREFGRFICLALNFESITVDSQWLKKRSTDTESEEEEHNDKVLNLSTHSEYTDPII